MVDACGFSAEGAESAAQLLCQAHALGWRRLVTFNWRGGRFAGCGLGPGTDDVRLDIYGDAGDYLGSGLDGARLYLHGDAQDQVGQILRRGQLVIHGDVGQTFLYGAKGGEIYVRGSAAGRPLINAVGRPRAVINGTCLDYLAESFMAGDPLDGGGFAILNGVTFDESGHLVELDSPYPGGNLFSLASGGAIYLRDPHGKVDDEQLNGGQFAALSDADWRLIEPYLRRNEALFGIGVDDLLQVGGEARPAQPGLPQGAGQVLGRITLTEPVSHALVTQVWYDRPRSRVKFPSQPEMAAGPSRMNRGLCSKAIALKFHKMISRTGRGSPIGQHPTPWARRPDCSLCQ